MCSALFEKGIIITYLIIIILYYYYLQRLNVHSYLYDITKLVLIDDFQKHVTIKEY